MDTFNLGFKINRAILPKIPSWLPFVGGVAPTLFADFSKSNYYYKGIIYPSFAAFNTSIGGTFSRASTATYLQGGVYKSALSNVARFPTDINGNPTGLRLTGAGTNLMLDSQFQNTGTHMSNIATTFTQNAALSPDGVNSTAAKLIEGSGTNTPFAYNSEISFTNTKYTFSIFVEAAERSSVYFGVYKPSGSQSGAVFTLSGAGSFVINDGLGYGATASITKIANSYYLLSVTLTPVVVDAVRVLFGFGTSFVQSYAMTPGSGAYFWGFQVTNTAFQLDYIPTTTTTVTQAADSYVVGPTLTIAQPYTLLMVENLPSWAASFGNNMSWGEVRGASDNNNNVYYSSGSTISLDGWNTGNGSRVTALLGSWTAGAKNKVAGVWRSSDLKVAGSINGAAVVTSAALGSSFAAADRIQFGSNQGNSPTYQDIAQFGFWSGVDGTSSLVGLTQ